MRRAKPIGKAVADLKPDGADHQCVAAGPSAGRGAGKALGPTDGPIVQGISVGRGATQRPCALVVSRLLDEFDKEIARSVLFLIPVLAARQSPANDSDMRLECPDPGHLTLDVDLSPPLPAGFSHVSYTITVGISDDGVGAAIASRTSPPRRTAPGTRNTCCSRAARLRRGDVARPWV